MYIYTYIYIYIRRSLLLFRNATKAQLSVIPLYRPTVKAQLSVIPLYRPTVKAQLSVTPLYRPTVKAQLSVIPLYRPTLKAQLSVTPLYRPTVKAQLSVIPPYALLLKPNSQYYWNFLFLMSFKEIVVSISWPIHRSCDITPMTTAVPLCGTLPCERRNGGVGFRTAIRCLIQRGQQKSAALRNYR